jgi:hypothetical protein
MGTCGWGYNTTKNEQTYAVRAMRTKREGRESPRPQQKKNLCRNTLHASDNSETSSPAHFPSPSPPVPNPFP